MNVKELAEKCVTAMNSSTSIGLKLEEANICIVTPKGWKAPPKFPRGEIVQWKEDGSRIRYLPSMNVLAWLVANGFVKLMEE